MGFREWLQRLTKPGWHLELDEVLRDTDEFIAQHGPGVRVVVDSVDRPTVEDPMRLETKTSVVPVLSRSYRAAILFSEGYLTDTEFYAAVERENLDIKAGVESIVDPGGSGKGVG